MIGYYVDWDGDISKFDDLTEDEFEKKIGFRTFKEAKKEAIAVITKELKKSELATATYIEELDRIEDLKEQDIELITSWE